MAYHSTLFSQVLAIISRDRFQSIVDRYQGDYRVRTYTCWSQLLVMIYAQLTDKDSLRDLESALVNKKNSSRVCTLLMLRVRRPRMPMRHATGKSIVTCFKNS